MFFALMLWLAACTCSPPPQEKAEPPADAALAPQTPVSVLTDDKLAYEYRIDTAKGDATIMRVYLDGRVQMGTVKDGAEPRWKNDTPLTPGAVERLQAAMSAPEVAALPAQLPVTPEAKDNSPNITWVMRQPDGTYKRIVAEKFAGMRVPPLDAIHATLRSARQATDVVTDWEVRLPDRLMRGRIPCHPAKLSPTRPVLDALRTDDLPAAEPAHFEPMLRIQWTEGELSWSTELSPQGLLVRRTGKESRAWTLPEDRRVLVAQLLTSFDVDVVGRLCR